MRVVVVGATGNVGTSVLEALKADPAIDSVLGIARRRPQLELEKVEWAEADIVRSDLVRLFRGADAVVHLAWLIQPSRDLSALRAVNVDGTRRVFDAAARAEVGALVYASSVGAYSPGPQDRAVDEGWPTDGVATSFYSRHKAEAERLLDAFERRHPGIRCVRLRPGLVFKHDAGTEIRRLFVGPFLPGRLVRRELIPLVPDVPGLRFQAVHSRDLGEAYRLAVLTDSAGGAYNVAAEPVLDPQRLAELLDARRVPLPAAVLRAAADVTWRLRLQPTPAGWVDMGLSAPIMDCGRIRSELGWQPRHDAGEALLELMAGIREGGGAETPPLDPATSGPLRSREIATGVGRESP